MNRVLHIAKREWLEQRRQPAMLSVITGLYLLMSGVILGPMIIIQLWDSDEAVRGALQGALGNGIEATAFIESMAQGTLIGFNFLLFTQFLGIAAVMAGHAVLHDRQSGTLTFLLLSPTRRLELFTGKVVGSMGPAFLLYLVISGGTALLLPLFPVSRFAPDYLPTNPAWWIAFAIGGPLWGVFIATVCTIVSSFASDVRTSQQAVWFVMFFGQFLCGILLTNGMTYGVAAQLAVSLGGGIAAVCALYAGSLTFRRDLGR